MSLRLLPTVDRVQVCSADNHQHLLSYLPQLEGKVDDQLRAGIDTARYRFRLEDREPDTMLFLGSFRHLPNQEGLEWFTRHVLPHDPGTATQRAFGRDRLRSPSETLVAGQPDAIELVGFVDDVMEPLDDTRFSCARSCPDRACA